MNPDFQYFAAKIEGLHNGVHDFDQLALEVFRLQATFNPVYRSFLKHLNTDFENIKTLTEIPFLPVSFFKNKAIKTMEWTSEANFESSGTTGQAKSKHAVYSLDFYHNHSTQIFEHTFGNLSKFQIVGLLPTYLDNPNSSLVSMVQHFAIKSGIRPEFCGLDFDKFKKILANARQKSRQILLFSVSYALMKLIGSENLNLADCLVIETGGFKGLEQNIAKAELLENIQNGLNINMLYSEYGMTEMLSQAYGQGENFKPSAAMRIFVRDLDDPFAVNLKGRGAANIVDLANFSTCSFIATDDLCQVDAAGDFQIMGRLDGSDLRGCNLLFY